MTLLRNFLYFDHMVESFAALRLMLSRSFIKFFVEGESQGVYLLETFLFLRGAWASRIELNTSKKDSVMLSGSPMAVFKILPQLILLR